MYVRISAELLSLRRWRDRWLRVTISQANEGWLILKNHRLWKKITKKFADNLFWSVCGLLLGSRDLSKGCCAYSSGGRQRIRELSYAKGLCGLSRRCPQSACFDSSRPLADLHAGCYSARNGSRTDVAAKVATFLQYSEWRREDKFKRVMRTVF